MYGFKIHGYAPFQKKGGTIMQASEIKKGIHWVGAIDWSMRSFHG